MTPQTSCVDSAPPMKMSYFQTRLSERGITLVAETEDVPSDPDNSDLTLQRSRGPARQHGETIRARGVAILHKPFDIDELLHLIQQLLGEKEPLRGSRS